MDGRGGEHGGEFGGDGEETVNGAIGKGRYDLGGDVGVYSVEGLVRG